MFAELKRNKTKEEGSNQTIDRSSIILRLSFLMATRRDSLGQFSSCCRWIVTRTAKQPNFPQQLSVFIWRRIPPPPPILESEVAEYTADESDTLRRGSILRHAEEKPVLYTTLFRGGANPIISGVIRIKSKGIWTFTILV
jgi:hypothetical protein